MYKYSMERYNFITSNIFDDLIKEYGIEGISDLDIREEILRNMKFDNDVIEWRVEACDITENGELDVFIEMLRE
jgi:hypothetical protein